MKSKAVFKKDLHLFSARLYQRRNGYFYVHLTVPHEIRPVIHRAQIKKALRTQNPVIALTLRDALEAALIRFIHSIHESGMDFIAPEDIRHHLKDIATDLAFLRKTRKAEQSP